MFILVAAFHLVIIFSLAVPREITRQDYIFLTLRYIELHFIVVHSSIRSTLRFWNSMRYETQMSFVWTLSDHGTYDNRLGAVPHYSSVFISASGVPATHIYLLKKVLSHRTLIFTFFVLSNAVAFDTSTCLFVAVRSLRFKVVDLPTQDAGLPVAIIVQKQWSAKSFSSNEEFLSSCLLLR